MWHLVNGCPVAKISRPLYCIKTWDTDHPMMEGHLHCYKSLKIQIKLFLIMHHWGQSEVSSGYKQELQTSAGTAATDHRIWFVIRRYKACQCRQNYLPTSSFSTLLWITSPTNGITTQRLKISIPEDGDKAALWQVKCLLIFRHVYVCD